MPRVVVRVKTFGKTIWHTKHMVVHVLLGLQWLRVSQSLAGETLPLATIAIIGSLVPDIEHLVYFFTYGRKDEYTRQIFALLKNKHWSQMIPFMERGHKQNTSLICHNFYMVGALMALCAFSFVLNFMGVFVFIGSMVTHYVFDVIEDIVLLGHVNPNWKRWGRGKRTASPAQANSLA